MEDPKDPIETKDPDPKDPEPKDPDPKDPEPKDPEGDEGIKDKHGQEGINKERHEKEMAAKDAKIKELEGKLEEKSQTEEGRKELKAELATVKEELADERLTNSLERAGCKGEKRVKAAKALLDDYEGDVEKLKAAESWLFSGEKQTGSTGLKPEGAPDDAEARMKKAREAAGLPTKKE